MLTSNIHHLARIKILCELADKELELEPGFKCELEPSAEPLSPDPESEPEPSPGSEFPEQESRIYTSFHIGTTGFSFLRILGHFLAEQLLGESDGEKNLPNGDACRISVIL